MLVIDPLNRISVEDALKHPYVCLWYDSIEVDAPAPGKYDSEVELNEHSVDEWKGTVLSNRLFYDFLDKRSCN